MAQLVDWAPNPHALIVHLPVGLLVTAVIADVVAMLRRAPSTVVAVSTGLHVAGTLALVTAYLTGRSAAPEVFTPGMAQGVVTQHWDWALRCMWYFGLTTTARLAFQLRSSRPDRVATVTYAVAGLAGLFLLAQTADLGARLVYEHGVGVAAPMTRGSSSP